MLIISAYLLMDYLRDFLGRRVGSEQGQYPTCTINGGCLAY